VTSWLNFGRPAPPGRGLQRGENFWVHLTTASAQCLRLSERFFNCNLSKFSTPDNKWKMHIWMFTRRCIFKNQDYDRRATPSKHVSSPSRDETFKAETMQIIYVLMMTITGMKCWQIRESSGRQWSDCRLPGVSGRSRGRGATPSGRSTLVSQAALLRRHVVSTRRRTVRSTAAAALAGSSRPTITLLCVYSATLSVTLSPTKKL